MYFLIPSILCFAASSLAASGRRHSQLLADLSDSFSILFEANQPGGLSILTRESYSSTRNATKLTIHSHEEREQDFHQFWFSNKTHRQHLWPEPFSCSSIITSLSDPTEERCEINLGSIILPKDLNKLLCYRGFGRELYGFTGLLYNLLQSQRAPIKLSQDPEQSFVRVLDERKLAFELTWPDHQRVRLNLYDRETVILQVNLVELRTRVDQQQDIQPPLGYVCTAPIGDEHHKQAIRIAKPPTMLLPHQIVFQVILMQGAQQLVKGRKPTSWPRDTLRPVEPIDSLVDGPRIFNAKQISLVVDPHEKLLASRSDDRLSVWDFNSRSKYQVLDGGSTCNHHLSSLAKSSLFTLSLSSLTCQEESVRLNLSQDLSIALNHIALNLLAGRLALNPTEVRWQEDEIVHETFLADIPGLVENLCLFKNDKHIKIALASIVRRYKLVEGHNQTYQPSSSVLQIYDEHDDLGRERTRLEMQLGLELISHEPYRPWKRSTHLIDLSSCTSAATLTIDYPLTSDQEAQIRRSSAGLREATRKSVATYLYSSHSVPITRIPSIEIAPLDQESRSLTLSIRLLDRLAPKGKSSAQEPSLIHLLDDIVSSIEQNTSSSKAQPVISMLTPVGHEDGLRYMHAIRIVPGETHYKLEEKVGLLEGTRFDILKPGEKLESKVNSGSALHKPEWDEFGFAIFDDEFEASDCAQLCLDHENCSVFSHCQTRGVCLITRTYNEMESNKFGPMLASTKDPDCSILVLRRQPSLLDQLLDFTRVARKAFPTSFEISASRYSEEQSAFDADSILVECAKSCRLEANCAAFEWCSSRHYGLSQVSCGLANESQLSETTLEQSANCSVYVFKQSSSSHWRRKVSTQRATFGEERAQENLAAVWRVEKVLEAARLDLVLLVAGFIFALSVRDRFLAEIEIRHLHLWQRRESINNILIPLEQISA